MKVLGSVVLLAAVAAALATTASAKEIKRAVVCGGTECRTLDGSNGMGSKMEALIIGNQNTTPPPASAFYTIKLVTREGNSWTELYVSAANKVRSMAPIGPQIWWAIPSRDRALFTKVVGDLEPYSAAAFPGPNDRTVPPPVVDTGSGWSVWWTIIAVASALVAAGAVAAARRNRTQRAHPAASA